MAFYSQSDNRFLCFYSEAHYKYFCRYSIGIEISNSSAEKQAQVTSNLDVVHEGGSSYLSKNLTLFIEGQKYEDVIISPELRGVVHNNVEISGVGDGRTEKEAISDAKLKYNKLSNILLDIK